MQKVKQIAWFSAACNRGPNNCLAYEIWIRIAVAMRPQRHGAKRDGGPIF